jgi:hypothetical protein
MIQASLQSAAGMCWMIVSRRRRSQTATSTMPKNACMWCVGRRVSRLITQCCRHISSWCVRLKIFLHDAAILGCTAIRMALPYPRTDIVIGYPKLAATIEVQPEIAIYRRFGALNAQNLLYFQAELQWLETKLRDQQAQDDKDTQGNGSQYAKNWYWLKDSENDANDKQIRLVMQIRATLKEYSKSALTVISLIKPLTSRR